MSKPYHVLFVCLGNICRSPMAESLFKHMVKSRKLDGQIFCDSCGIQNYHVGEPPHHLTLEVLAGNGIKDHSKARKIANRDFVEFDLILSMDASVHRHLQQIAPLEHRDKIRMMRDWDDFAPGADVPDPYMGGRSDFQEVYKMLDRSCTKLLDEIVHRDDPV